MSKDCWWIYYLKFVWLEYLILFLLERRFIFIKAELFYKKIDQSYVIKCHFSKSKSNFNKCFFQGINFRLNSQHFYEILQFYHFYNTILSKYLIYYNDA